MGLVQASLADADALRLLPLRDYAGIVEIEEQDLRFYPTLFDFIAESGIGNLKVFADAQNLNVLNERLLETPCDPTLRPGPTCRPLGMILGIYGSVIDFHKDSPAPRFVAEIAVREFVERHMFTSRMAAPRSAAAVADNMPSAFTAEMIRLYEENKDNELSGLFLDKAAEEFYPGEEAREFCALADNLDTAFCPGFRRVNQAFIAQRVLGDFLGQGDNYVAIFAALGLMHSQAIREVDFAEPAGRNHAILAPAGAGKRRIQKR